VVFWIAIPLCIFALWAATSTREMVQRGLEPRQPFFLRKQELDSAENCNVRLLLSSRFDEARLLNLLLAGIA
jgi:hypothetical protein